MPTQTKTNQRPAAIHFINATTADTTKKEMFSTASCG
jgi:hypothetical protein